jgi:hypothetical protein
MKNHNGLMKLKDKYTKNYNFFKIYENNFNSNDNSIE